MSIRVLRAGAFTSVQDRGRSGRQHDGVPVSGAMDDVALRVGNALVGNPGGAAALEATLVGPSLAFDVDAYVAVTGADMDARVNGRRLAPWWATPIHAGETLTLDAARVGCRSYIAIAGGFDVPEVLGSRSTYARAGFGGVQGRKLARGDVLATGVAEADAVAGGAKRRNAPRGVDVRHLELQRATVRIIPGPHLALLNHQSWRTLFESAFTLTPESDRMGLRFAGAPLVLSGAVELLSAGVAMGTVQLPPEGSPIILMADRQTTGGYPRLGEIATVDLPVLAQLRPGDQVRFAEVSAEEAERLYLEREREVVRLGLFL